MNPRKPLNLTRQLYRQGQTLLAGDFQQQLRTEDQIRWWHNRAVHNSYGLAWQQANPSLDDKKPAINLPPTLAYDCFGREVLFTDPCSVALPDPPKAGESFEPMLLIARVDDAPLECPIDGAGAFPGCCSNRRPSLCWVTRKCWSFRDGVPVSWIEFDNGEFRISTDSLPRAQALARHHIGAGASLPGKTPWKLLQFQWTDFDFDPDMQRLARIFTAEIDTSTAGFTDTPCYFAWLLGPRYDIADPAAINIFGGWVDEEEPDRFRFSILVAVAPRSLTSGGNSDDPVADAFGKFNQDKKLSVLWVGVEHVQPPLSDWRPCGCHESGAL